MRYLALHEQQEMREAIDREQDRTTEKGNTDIRACMCVHM